MEHLKPCPVCGSEGMLPMCNACPVERNACTACSNEVVCPTCHGRGTIRPTQDPRFLFWTGVAYIADQKICHFGTPIEKLNRWHYAYNNALNKCDAILVNKPRRTTAKWRETK